MAGDLPIFTYPASEMYIIKMPASSVDTSLEAVQTEAKRIAMLLLELL
jgi:hypothetical protein